LRAIALREKAMVLFKMDFQVKNVEVVELPEERVAQKKVRVRDGFLCRTTLRTDQVYEAE
jgi:hypothetical protein